MSVIQGKKRESKGFEKAVGVFEGKVIAVNPTKEELETIYGTSQDKDPEYTGEKEVKVGDESMMVDASRIVVFLKDVKSGSIFQTTFYLENRDKTNKDQTKKQYINSAGTTSWAEDDNGLKEWFTARDYRVAKVGEEELYDFVKNWLAIDFRDKDAQLDLGWKDLIAGKVDGLKGQIGGDLEQTVVALATIRTVEKDGEVKEYQGVYNRAFLPGYNIKQFRIKNFDDDVIATIAGKAPKEQKPFEKFVVKVSDSEYGVKDFYSLKELHAYDATQNVAAGDSVIDDTDSSY